MGEESDRLGERLVKSGLLTEEQLNEALELQESIGGRLGALLIKLGLLGSDQLAEVLSIMCQVPLIKADDIFVDHKLIKTFERTLMEKRNFVPISSSGNTIKIAAADPSDVDVINLVEFETEKSVNLCAMSQGDIQRLLNLVFVEHAPVAKRAGAAQQPMTKVKARAQIRNSSFREVLLALVDELHDKGVVEYAEILRRIEQRHSEDE